MALQNLPGFEAQYNDGGLAVARRGVTTNSVLLLGTAVDGPVNVPWPVTQLEDAEKIFGSAGARGVDNGTTLIKGLYEAYNAGCRDIRLMRITGATAKAQIKGQTSTANVTRNILEGLGSTNGNTEIVIDMKAGAEPLLTSGSELVEGSVVIKAGTTVIPASYYVIDYDQAVITVPAGTVDDDASLALAWKERKTQDTEMTDANMYDSTGAHTTFKVAGCANWKAAPAPVIKVNTVTKTVDTDYTVTLSTGTVVFKSALLATDAVTATFTYSAEVVADGDGSTVSASGVDKVVTLTNAPVPPPATGTNTTPLKVFIAGSEAASTTYSVNYDEKKVTILKGNYPAGQTIQVSYWYTDTVDNTASLDVEAVAGGKLYDSTKFVIANIREGGVPTGRVLGKSVTLIKPASKKKSASEAPLVFSSLDYPTFADLASAINSHSLNNVVIVEVDSAYSAYETRNIHIESGESVEVSLAGGDDGLTASAADMYKILEGEKDEAGNVTKTGVYDLLMNYIVDMVVPLGVYADEDLADPTKNFAEQLANFCARCAVRNYEVTGIIPVKKLHPSKNNLAGIQEYVDALVARGNGYYFKDDNGNYVVGSDGNKLDVGRYVSVLVSEPTFTSNSLGRYSNSFSAAYAGLISTLAPENAPTNKLLINAQGLRYEFSPAQLDALTGARYVTLQNRFGRGVVVVDGVTCAQRGSDYTRLSTWRITTAATRLIRRVADPFIGGPNTPVMRNALGTEIAHALDAMKKSGALTDYRFNIISTTRDAMMGNAIIELTIVPTFELRNIRLVVSLRPTL